MGYSPWGLKESDGHDWVTKHALRLEVENVPLLNFLLLFVPTPGLIRCMLSPLNLKEPAKISCHY